MIEGGVRVVCIVFKLIFYSFHIGVCCEFQPNKKNILNLNQGHEDHNEQTCYHSSLSLKQLCVL